MLLFRQRFKKVLLRIYRLDNEPAARARDEFVMFGVVAAHPTTLAIDTRFPLIDGSGHRHRSEGPKLSR